MKERQETDRKDTGPTQRRTVTGIIRCMLRQAAVLLALLLLQETATALLPRTAMAEKAAGDECRRVYRALLIGQSYAETEGLTVMQGGIQDAEGLQAMLQEMDATPYEITVYTDLSAEGIREALKEVFSASDRDDVCLFYYAGHGYESDDDSLRGALTGTDGGLLPFRELCGIFSGIHGDRIIILDSCYSGNIAACLSEMPKAEGSAERVNVLCAAGASERTEEISRSGVGFGLFTKGLTEGSQDEGTPGISLPADRDGNLEISMTEAYYYTKVLIQRYARNQHPCIWPEGEDAVLWGRTPGTVPEE